MVPEKKSNYQFTGPGPGRDLIWEDPSAMLQKGLEYFQVKQSIGERYTISGLALFLGLSYWSLNEYSKRPGFGTIVHQLKSQILEQAEKLLFDKDTCTGAKFHASVLGMNEKIVVESQNTNHNVNVEITDLSKLSPEELENLKSLLEKMGSREDE